MRALHDIVANLVQRIIWYGPDATCTSTYHNGYDYERPEGNAHHECAQGYFRQRGFSTYISTYCACLECDTNPHYHYFFIPNEGDLDDYRVHYDDPDDGYYYCCLNCRQGNHPTFPGVRECQ